MLTFITNLRYLMILCQGVLILFHAGAGLHWQRTSDNPQALIQDLIADLYKHPWPGAERVAIPTIWEFNFTKPMAGILQLGPIAQPALLAKLTDQEISEQVIVLLGGVGDERVIGPIIDTMVAAKDLEKTPNALRINQAANLALTNITASDVIWHRGGGIVIERCYGTAKECWQKWWENNQTSFTVKNVRPEHRQYANYPNYGIYKQR